ATRPGRRGALLDHADPDRKRNLVLRGARPRRRSASRRDEGISERHGGAPLRSQEVDMGSDVPVQRRAKTSEADSMQNRKLNFTVRKITPLHTGFLKISRYDVEVERRDGGTLTLSREVMERGH